MSPMIPVAKIKYIRSLQQKKFRRQYGVFVAEGEKIVGELVQAATTAGGGMIGSKAAGAAMTSPASSKAAGGAANDRFTGGGQLGGANMGPFSLECICALQEWMDLNGKLLPPVMDTHIVSPAELGRISGLSSPNQVLAVVRTPEYQWSPQELLGGQTLVLDSIQDPGNMGTIIRTADWFGIRTVFCSPDSADVFSPKVIQSSMGSFLRVKTVYTDLLAMMEEMPYEHPVYGAFLDGEDVFSVTPAKPSVLVIGNESRGISAELLPFIGRHVRIPGYRMPGEAGTEGGSGITETRNDITGSATEAGPGAKTGPESLNASVAAGILMAWLTRERG